MTAPSIFEFEDDKSRLAHDDTLLVEIPAGIDDVRELVTLLKKQTALPDYCGANLNALDECLNDLSWIAQGRLVLFHRDVPFPGDLRYCANYVDVLATAIQRWNEDGLYKLIVVFPRASFDEIKKALKTPLNG